MSMFLQTDWENWLLAKFAILHVGTVAHRIPFFGKNCRYLSEDRRLRLSIVRWSWNRLRPGPSEYLVHVPRFQWPVRRQGAATQRLA